jgi:hypothetical protein
LQITRSKTLRDIHTHKRSLIKVERDIAVETFSHSPPQFIKEDIVGFARRFRMVHICHKLQAYFSFQI